MRLEKKNDNDHITYKIANFIFFKHFCIFRWFSSICEFSYQKNGIFPFFLRKTSAMDGMRKSYKNEWHIPKKSEI